jgi:phosphonate degradation associated HDIG domain protein
VSGTVLHSVDDIVALYRRWADRRYDEVVTQMAHALQCAALARRDAAGEVMVVAALLHDVGHLLHLAESDGEPGDLEGDRHHEVRGAAALAGVFDPAVTEPIRLHVAAKRYLCAREPAHLAGLSAGSVRSLRAQGGPMTPEEMATFAAEAFADDAVQLRRWDDAGKVVGLDVQPFDSYLPLLQRCALRSSRRSSQ